MNVNLLMVACGAVVSFAACAGEESAPFSIVRFGAEVVRDAQWRDTLPVLVKNKAVCDEVWFSTGGASSPLEVHRQRASDVARCAEELCRAGIVASLQVQATVGHGEDAKGGKPAPHRTWRGFTDATGYEAVRCNCPRDPAFRAHCAAAMKPYAAWKPGSVWIDDDLRLDRHGVLSTGCFCELCLKAFSEREGKVWTRTALVAAMKTDLELAKRWRRHGFEGLAGLAAAITEVFHAESPTTRMGLQYPWCDEGQILIVEAMSRAAGGAKIGIRPGCGAYSDRDPFDQIDKCNRLARQMKTLLRRPELFSQICPEIETCPRTFGMRTARSLAFEALIHLAQGCDSLSWYMMNGDDPGAWFDRNVFRALRENMGLYRRYVRANSGTVLCGFGCPDVGESPEAPNFPVGYAVTGVPLCFTGEDVIGTILPAGSLKRLSEDALVGLLKGGVVTDMDGLRGLQRRKLLPDSIRGVGRYSTPQKGRIGISPELDPGQASGVENRRYRERALFAAGRLPAQVLDPCLASVWCRVRKDGAFASMVMLNARIDRQEPVRVKLWNFPSTKAVWWPLWGEPRELEVRHAAGWSKSCEVTLPEIGAWSAGVLLPQDVTAGVSAPGRLECPYGALFARGHHVQGIAAAEDGVYFTQSGAIHHLGWDGRLVKSVEGPHHFGDPFYWQGRLYVAYSPHEPRGQCGYICVYDAKTLKLLKKSARLADPVDGLAVFNGVVYAGTKSFGRVPNDCATLAKFDPETLEEKGLVTIPLGFKTMYYGPQNLTVSEGCLYLGCYGAADRSIPDTLVVDADLKPVRTLRTGCGEGLDAVPENLSNAVVGPAGKGRFLTQRTLWWRGFPKTTESNVPRLAQIDLRRFGDAH